MAADTTTITSNVATHPPAICGTSKNVNAFGSGAEMKSAGWVVTPATATVGNFMHTKDTPMPEHCDPQQTNYCGFYGGRKVGSLSFTVDARSYPGTATVDFGNGRYKEPVMLSVNGAVVSSARPNTKSQVVVGDFQAGDVIMLSEVRGIILLHSILFDCGELPTAPPLLPTHTSAVGARIALFVLPRIAAYVCTECNQ